MDVLQLRRLHGMVAEETDAARAAFPLDKSVESLPLVYGLNATVEEVGKLARCFNKLVIAEDPQVIDQWNKEAIRRIITSLSLLERIYLTMEARPRTPRTYYSREGDFNFEVVK